MKAISLPERRGPVWCKSDELLFSIFYPTPVRKDTVYRDYSHIEMVMR